MAAAARARQAALTGPEAKAFSGRLVAPASGPVLRNFGGRRLTGRQPG